MNDQECTIDAIDDCLIIAGKFDGRVIGDYVRNVIVPLSFNVPCNTYFTDVDIWFKTKLQVDNFIKAVNDSNSLSFKENDNLAFARKRRQLYQYNKHVTNINIIISENLPVNDFDVDQLVYLYRDNKKISESFGKASSELLIKAIRFRQVTILPDYFKMPAKNHYRSYRLNMNFINYRWRILYSDISQFPSNFLKYWQRNSSLTAYNCQGYNVVADHLTYVDDIVKLSSRLALIQVSINKELYENQSVFPADDSEQSDESSPLDIFMENPHITFPRSTLVKHHNTNHCKSKYPTNISLRHQTRHFREDFPRDGKFN